MNQNYYTYGVEHTPDFEAYEYKGSAGSILNGKEIDLADVIYDYKLSIDESKMTKVKIDEYGLKISADKHAFIAEKAQAVNNKISLIIDYILINGKASSKLTTLSLRRILHSKKRMLLWVAMYSKQN